MKNKTLSVAELSQNEINFVSGGINWEAYIGILALPATIVLIGGGNLSLLLIVEGGILAHGVACGIADFAVGEDAHKSLNKALVSIGMGSLLFAMGLLAKPIIQVINARLGQPNAAGGQ